MFIIIIFLFFYYYYLTFTQQPFADQPTLRRYFWTDSETN